MRIYFAGSVGTFRAREQRLFVVIRARRMLSFAYCGTVLTERRWTEHRYSLEAWMARDEAKVGTSEPRDVDLFLDSGAFSAWTRGVTIPLEDYAQFVLDRPGVFSVVANLDVIPGAWGHVPSSREIDESAARGWENYWALKRMLAPVGVVPMHIFHQGEDFKWLKKLMDEAEYFGLSPGNDRTTAQKIAWLDQCMRWVCDARGLPLRRFHGFAVTSLDLMRRYPWASCDSTSWVMTARFGGAFIVLNGTTHKVTFSNESPDRSEVGKHYASYTKGEQAAIRRYVESKGLTVEQLATDYTARDRLNILYFLDLERTWVDRPFQSSRVQPTLLR